MNYKDTLNLPKTGFPMKADLPKKEPQILKRWEDMNIYHLIRQSRKGKPKHILHDGPPYANGDIHIGHALNKILKDIVVKYKTMRNFDSPFVPGWDCHGLPVEHQLFKEMNIKKSQIERIAFRKKAYDFAMKFVEIQKEQFKRLGVFGDWGRPYLTLEPTYEAQIIGSFGHLVKRGFIYRGLKPVNWCFECETALAEAELEYENHTSPSTYVKFKLLRAQNNLPSVFLPLTSEQMKNTYFLIWTTTPWTLVSNVAVAVHPQFEYVLIRAQKSDPKSEVFIIARDLLEVIVQKIGIGGSEIIGTVLGRELEGLNCRHPFIDRLSLVVLAEYVSNEEGTGCVHIAPGHGREDFQTALRYNLPVIMPVNSKGEFDRGIGEFAGMNVYDANFPIIERLKRDGCLLHSEEIVHSYPHCWRCKNPIIFRATRQWFMSVDHRNLRQRILEVVERQVRWIPEIGRDRISSMTSSRPDWCLSRQRYWGVPLPVFYCKKCGRELLDIDIIERVKRIVEREGSDAWFIKNSQQLLPQGTRCQNCKGEAFVKEEDIIDVWFDSGISHQAVLRSRKELSFPSDLYLEGSDQHRGWFQSALITALGLQENSPPFKEVLTHGFVVDGQGRKMSKSIGNVVSPQEVIETVGAEILRLWAVSSDYTEDIRISEQILSRLSEAYRKVRNTIRFLLGNLYDFDHKKDFCKFEGMLQIDRWVLSQAAALFFVVTESYEKYAFHRVYQAIHHFCTVTLSNFYLDVLKDRLYTFPSNSPERRSAQSALYKILNLLVKLVAPILSFTAEEAWHYIAKEDKLESVHLLPWPDENEINNFLNEEIDRKWGRLIQLREDVLKVLEVAREADRIGSSLEAEVCLWLQSEELYLFLKEYEEQLPSIFIVSQVKVDKVDSFPKGSFISQFSSNLAISLNRAKGKKCQRCWNYSPTVGRDAEHVELCARCIWVIGSFAK